MSIQLVFDEAEPRMTLSGLRGLDYGATWDIRLGSGVAMDAPSLTCILIPLPLTPEWDAATGSTARRRKSNFNIGASADWVETAVGTPTNYYLTSVGTVSSATTVKLTEPLAANRGLYVSWFTPNWGQGKGTALNFGWLSSAAAVHDLTFSVLNDGQVLTYAGTVFAGARSIAEITRMDTMEARISDLETQFGEASDTGYIQTGEQITNTFQSIMVIPRPPRELIVVSPTAGGGFVVTLPDMPHDDGSGVLPQITPPGTAWVQVPEGQACVQLWPLKYATEGTVVSMPHWMYYAPGSVQTGTCTVFYGTVGSGCSVSGSAVAHPYSGSAFSANGTANAYRTRCVLTGPGEYTPYVYGAQNSWTGVMGTTYAGSVDVASWIMAGDSFTLSVPTNPSGVTLRFRARSPEALAALAAQPELTYNRPVSLYVTNPSGGTMCLFKGANEPPRYDAAMNDAATFVEFECRDWWARLENSIVTDPMILDGQAIGTVVTTLLSEAGVGTAQMSIDDVDFRMPYDNHPSNGGWRSVVKVGDTPAKWLEAIHRDHARTFYMGWRPGTAGPVFQFSTPDSLGTVSAGTVFLTLAEAGGDPSGVVRSFTRTRPRPLANEVLVEGLEPGTNQRVQARVYDVDSYIAETAPEERPDDWIGEQRVMIYQNPALPTHADCAVIASLLLDRLANRPAAAEVECEMQWRSDGRPVWRGDILTVGTVNYRVQSLETRFVYDGTLVSYGTATAWRPTKYVLEEV